MSEISEKLREILDSEGFVDFVLDNLRRVTKTRNNGELAQVLGVSPSTVSTWKKRNTVPYREIVRYCLLNEIEIEFAIFGETANPPKADAAWLENFVVVRRYGVEASAGHGSIVNDEEILEYMAFQRQWLRTIGVTPDSAIVLTARGDSMEPLISSGDLVVVDESKKDLTDGIFVLRLDSHLIIKRVQNLLDGRWLLKSENEAYDPITISTDQAEDLHVVGRARYTWAGRRL